MNKLFFTILLIFLASGCVNKHALKNDKTIDPPKEIILSPNISNLCQYCENNQTVGHRGGGDEEYCPVPENSLLALKVFKKCGGLNYLEFDINSTKDHNLVVFHGPQLWKFIELDDINDEVFKKIYQYEQIDRDKLTVQNIKYSELNELQLKLNKKAKKMINNNVLPPVIVKKINKERIPLLSEYLTNVREFAIPNTLRFDIKMISEKKEMEYFFELIDSFKQEASNKIEISLTTKWTQGRRWQRLPKEAKQTLCEIGGEKGYLVKKIQKRCKKFLN